MLKRSFDFVVSLTLLLVLAPALAVLALLVRAILGSPVLFVQVRPGFKGAPFSFYKFRTMNSATDPSGKLLPDEARLSRFGRMMRKSSLDELPQLLNVVKGDMSLVGPRPLLMEYLPLYTPRQARRHDVRPGITGWAQVNGRNAVDWAQRFEMDIWYVENRSFRLDLKILFLTVLRVLRPSGISKAGHATMPRFTGSDRSDGSG